jgi:hypothetical protein
MPDAKLKVRVAHDRTTVAISPGGRQSSHQVELTLGDLDKLISELGNARSQMVEGQPSPKFDQQNAPISVAANTTWYIEAAPPRGVLLAFYHPKFGPVGFTLQRDQITRIVRFLASRFIHQLGPSAERH